MKIFEMSWKQFLDQDQRAAQAFVDTCTRIADAGSDPNDPADVDKFRIMYHPINWKYSIAGERAMARLPAAGAGPDIVWHYDPETGWVHWENVPDHEVLLYEHRHSGLQYYAKLTLLSLGDKDRNLDDLEDWDQAALEAMQDNDIEPHLAGKILSTVWKRKGG